MDVRLQSEGPSSRLGHTMVEMDTNDEVIQVAERQLADAEEAYRLEPSDANRRRIMKAWSAVRRVRGEPDDGRGLVPPFRTDA
jgi:hypothetical protein